MNIFQTAITINGMMLPNRLVMPPMATAKAEGDGRVSEKLCDYYAEKSRGGFIGLVITEHSYVSPEGKAGKGQLSIADDGVTGGLQKLVSSVHGNGTRIMAQISHAGGAAVPDLPGTKVLSASSVRSPKARVNAPTPEEMTHSDIQKVTDDFAEAALRAKKAGYDGVEIHAAHGYLLNQFYSPLTNRRTDEFTGQTIQGRLRLHLEILRSVRQAVGADYPLSMRLGACDYMEGGTTIGDSVIAAEMLEQEGLDLLDISGGFCMYTNPCAKEQGYFSEISGEIKKHCSLPVLLTGGIVEAQAAERLLEEKKADLIGVGRAILRDSGWPRKAMEKENL